MSSIEELAAKLGVTFADHELLETAVTHRSYLNEQRRRQKLGHNERLEFLGDAVLELIVTEHLYKNYDDPEGVLTNWRSALVRTESLSKVATAIDLDQYLRLSRGEARGSERARKQIMANAIEAVIGAIYLDQGYTVAGRFVTDFIIKDLPEIISTGSWQDAKTALQELVQEEQGVTPTYKVLDSSGPDHDKQFTVGVYVGKKLAGRGSGASKQNAQQAAAEQALSQLQESK